MNDLSLLIAEKLGLALDYVEEYFPQVYERYVDYNITLCTIGVVVSSVLLLIAIAWIVVLARDYLKPKSKLWNQYQTRKYLNDLSIIVSFVIGIVSIFSIVILVCDAVELVGWTQCPEMKIIKELTGK